jgi:hypothetical protein
MITINPSSSLIIYVMNATNKRLLISESRGDSNWCTPCRGKLDQHVTLSTLSPRMVYDHTYLMQSTYCNISYSRQHIWTDPLHPRRMSPDTIHSTPTDRSVGPYPASLPQQSMEQWEKVKLQLTSDYYAYRSHITDMRSVRSILAHGG